MRNTEEDRKIIENVQEWPLKYVLCMKCYKDRKPGQFPSFGVMLADNHLKIYKVGISEMVQMTKEELDAEPYTIYPDLDAMFADEWVVD